MIRFVGGVNWTEVKLVVNIKMTADNVNSRAHSKTNFRATMSEFLSVNLIYHKVEQLR